MFIIIVLDKDVFVECVCRLCYFLSDKMSSRKAGRGRTVATGDTSLSPGQLDSSGGYAVDGPSSAQSSQPSQPLRAASVVDPVDFGGNISRSPSSVSVQGSSLSKG